MVHSDRVYGPQQHPNDGDRDSITDKGWHEPYYELKSKRRLAFKLLRLWYELYKPNGAYSVDKQR